MTTVTLTYTPKNLPTGGIGLYAVGLWDAGKIIEATPSLYTVDALADYAGVNKLFGFDFTYDASGNLTGGTVTAWELWWPPLGEMFWSMGVSVPATTFAGWIAGSAGPTPNDVLFAGDDSFTGGAGRDTLQGEGGNDTVLGGSGDDRLDGGTPFFNGRGGPDPLKDGSNYLRGGEGDDVITGGSGFDDINGNQGNDTAHGGAGDDWVVGGKDQDVLFGDDGGDIVYGNLGNDTCDGGPGADLVRGGQGDDSLSGGAGDDWLSGDLGDDTISGGAGADVFHTFGGAGLDRVLDFNHAEGDRVQLDPGTTYAVSQVGADVVIDITGGARMVLVAVSMASLTEGWIGAA